MTQAVLKGSQTPRIQCHPAYASSAGREAVDLARSVGLWPDEWQRYVLEHALGERRDGTWAAFEIAVVVGRQNGKNSILEARELAGLFLFGEQLILHSAHEFKTAQEAFRRVLGLIEAKDHLRKRVKRVRTSHGEEGIELLSGQRLRFIARSTGSGRGFTGDCVIFDEAYNLGGDAMAAMLPTLSSRPNPQVWYTSSAGMDTSEQLLSVHERGVAGESPRLAYFEWSAPPIEGVITKEMLRDRREDFAAANPALGIRISEEFVEAELDALPVPEFLRERLGYWPDLGISQVIPMALWASLADPESEMVSRPVFAADANPERSRSAIAAVGRRADGLYHLEVIDERPGTAWVPQRLAELKATWEPPCEPLIDPAGPAGAWLPELTELGVEPVLLTGREMAQACGLLFEMAVEKQELRHLAQQPLTSALQGAQQRPLADAWAWHRRNSVTNIAPLVAVTEALQGFMLYGNEGDALDNIW